MCRRLCNWGLSGQISVILTWIRLSRLSYAKMTEMSAENVSIVKREKCFVKMLPSKPTTIKAMTTTQTPIHTLAGRNSMSFRSMNCQQVGIIHDNYTRIVHLLIHGQGAYFVQQLVKHKQRSSRRDDLFR